MRKPFALSALREPHIHGVTPTDAVVGRYVKLNEVLLRSRWQQPVGRAAHGGVVVAVGLLAAVVTVGMYWNSKHDE